MVTQSTNYLSPFGFHVTLERAPGVAYFCQEAIIPGINLPVVPVSSPLKDIPYPGDRLYFDDLIFTFRVDGEMRNWLEIVEWLKELGYPESTDQYKRASPTGDIRGPDAKVFSDITISILSGKHNPLAHIFFKDAFPRSLSSLRFSAMDSEVEYITCTATLTYAYYTINSDTQDRSI